LLSLQIVQLRRSNIRGPRPAGLWVMGPPTLHNNALSARGQPGSKAPEYHQEVILPTCLSQPSRSPH